MASLFAAGALGARALKEASPPPAWRSWFQAAIWLALLAIVLLAAALSIPYLIIVYRDLAPAIRPSVVGAVAMAGAYCAVLAGALGLLALIAHRSTRIGMIVALGLLVVLRIAVPMAVDGPLASDWEHYHQLALATLRGSPPIADIPMGFPLILGLSYRLGGVSIASGEAINAVAAITAGILLAAWVWRWAGPVAATLAVGLLALTPSEALHATLLGSESWFCVAVVAAAFAATELFSAEATGMHGRSLLLAGIVGLSMGAAYWIRTTGLPVLLALAALPLIAMPLRRAAVHAITILLAGAVVLAPIAAANVAILGRLSVSNSLYLGWQLYIGANVETAGTFNEADEDRLADRLGRAPLTTVGEEFASGNFDADVLRSAAREDAVAAGLAAERISSLDLPQLAGLIVKKVRTAWARADNAASWVFDRASSAPGPASAWAHIASQVAWCVSLWLAAAWLISQRKRRPAVGLVVAAVVLPIFLSTLVLEAQSRYHEPAVPLLAAFAGAWLASSIERWEGLTRERTTVRGWS